MTGLDLPSELAGLRGTWAVAGGWAVDLAVGRPTRPHHDLDLFLLRADQRALRAAFAGWSLKVAHAGGLLDWAPDDWVARPRHELQLFDPAGRMVEFLLNDAANGIWRFRRSPLVMYPLARTVRRAASGIPVLALEVALLYKAKRRSADDEADFRIAVPRLDEAARRWLASSLRRVHPGHPWIRRLG